jgi:hypothetical protein
MHPKVSKKPVQKQRRPRSVSILAWLHLVQSLVLLVIGAFIFQSSSGVTIRIITAIRLIPLAVFQSMISVLVMVILAVFGVFIAIALFRLKPWAWLAAMSLQGIGLVAALYGYITGRPNYVGMLLGIVLVLYLNQYEVRIAFREQRDVRDTEILRQESGGR